MILKTSLLRCIFGFQLLLLVSSCATPAPEVASGDQVTILGFNDFHASLDTDGPAALFGSEVGILRAHLGSRLVLLSSGNDWQGSTASELLGPQPTIEWMNLLGVQAATLGRGDLHFVSTLKPSSQDQLEEAKRLFHGTYLSLNTPGFAASLQISAGGHSIGVIGITGRTSHEMRTSEAEPTKRLLMDARTITSLAKKLRTAGANAVVLLANLGITCQPLQNTCDPDMPLARLLRAMPEKTVDAVVAGNQHRSVANWYRGTPIIQSAAHGSEYHLLHFQFDSKTAKLLRRQTTMESRTLAAGNTLLGQRVRPEPVIQALLEKIRDLTRNDSQEVLAEVPTKLELLQPSESPLGNLVADAARDAAHADFALINPGSLPSHIEKGPLTRATLFRLFPYRLQVVRLRVKGSDLKTLLEIANSGARGFSSVSRLRVGLIDLPFQAKSKDLNADRRISHWEVNRTLQITEEDGTPLQSSKIYTLATTDYLAQGGDDLGWIMARIRGETTRPLESFGLLRDAVVKRLQAHASTILAFDPLTDTPRTVLYSSEKAFRHAHRRTARIQKRR